MRKALYYTVGVIVGLGVGVYKEEGGVLLIVLMAFCKSVFPLDVVDVINIVRTPIFVSKQ